MEKVVILGTGPAGLTAAIYLARANMKPLVIEGIQPGGQLTLTTEVENFPGFVEGIMGPELMDNMRKQAERFGAEFKRGWVTEVNLSKKPYTLQVNGLGEIQTETLILSTGASAKLLNIPGEKENIGRGVSTCATCDGFFFRGKKVIIVGGGDSAMEEANFLTKFAKEVTIVHRRDELRASKIMRDRAKANNKISWALNNTPLEVVSDGLKVTGLKVRDNATGKEELIQTDGIFVAIGHTPNTAFLKDQIDTDETGYINVVPGSTETNIPGVFACGDVQDRKYRQAITAAGTGCMAALDAERYLEGNATHDWSKTLPTKNYHELIKDRIFIGGADDVQDMLENEKANVIFDLRAETTEVDYDRFHCPIVDDAENQDESIKKSIEHVVKAYNEGKKVFFHCQGGSNRTGTVAIGTLLSLGKAKTIDEAEDIAKAARPKIKVKPEMKESLKRIFPDS